MCFQGPSARPDTPRPSPPVLVSRPNALPPETAEGHLSVEIKIMSAKANSSPESVARPSRILVLFLTVLAGGFLVAPRAMAQDRYASSVTSYTSGTGVAAGYTDPSAALGEPSRVTPGAFGGPVDPFSAPYLGSQLVGLGTDGSLTVQFNTPIRNDSSHTYGLDFQVFGNSFFVVTNGFDADFNYIGTPATDGSVFGAGAADARISVSADGVHFFTLNPALAPELKNLFPSDGSGDFSKPVNPAAGNAAFAGLTLDGIRAVYSGSGGGAGFDLAWAQDSGGHAVNLDQASYVRIEVTRGKLQIDGFSLVGPLTSVPEPSVWALGALGLIPMLWASRKR